MTAPPDQPSPALERVLGNFSGILRQERWRYRFSGAEVDELLQEVRVRLWRSRSEPAAADAHVASISASYLQRTALSAAIDMVRRRRARGGDRAISIGDEHEPLPQRHRPEHELEQSGLAAQVERAIESIHPSRRPIVRMHLLGHAREEIARLLGWPEAKTRNLLDRGLADVREHLIAQGVRWASPT